MTNKQYSADEMLDMNSGQVMFILDECKQELRSILGELTSALTNYKALERMLPHKLAVIKTQFLDIGIARNEASDRAMASSDYLDALNKITEAYDSKKELELLYDVLLNNIKAITSLCYLKNTELKTGV
jgi:hypothetical protein